MSSVIRPYADLEGIFAGLEYRANGRDAFQTIDIDGAEASTIVRVDDLRTIPQHELKVQLAWDRLKPHYTKHADKLRLIIVVRDTALRRELRLCDFALDEIPSTIDLDRNLLKTTALRDVLPLSFSIVLDTHLGGSSAYPNQRASRLAELRFIITNSSQGATFPFKRVTAEELKAAGKPPETGVHLELLCEPRELIKAVDTPMANLFQVWVHERIWAAVQQDRAPATSRLRQSGIALITMNLLLSTVTPLLRDDEKIDEGSVIGQLLSFVEDQASLQEGRLREQFESEGTLHAIEPYLQNAWRFVSNAARIEEDSEELQ